MTQGAGGRKMVVSVMRLPPTESGWGQAGVGVRGEVTKLNVRAKHQSGMEIVRAGQPVSAVRASLRGNFRTDVRASDELWYGDVHYKIVAVLPDYERKRHTDYVCEVLNGTGPE